MASFAPDTRYRVGLAALLALVTLVTLVSVQSSLEWIGRPFNGFLLGRNRIVAPIVQPSWTGPRAGIPYWSELVAINGAAVRDVGEALAAARIAGPGGSIQYTLRSGDDLVTLPIQAMTFTAADYAGLFANYLFNGLAFLCIGFFVAFLRPRLEAARAMLLFSLSWGLSLIVSLADFASYHFRDLLAVAEATAPASLVYLTLCFPAEHPAARRRSTRAALLGVSAVLAVLNVVLYDRAPRWWILSYQLGLVVAAAAIVLSIWILWTQFRTAASAIAREKIKIVFLGIVVAFAFPAAAFAAGRLIGAELPLNVLPAASWIFPAALAYAIVKRDLFEIDVFLRRAASYVALSAAVVVLYVVVVGFFGVAFHSLDLAASPWFTLAFSLAVLAVVRPLRDRLQAAVDRIFFRTRFDFAGTAEALSRSLARTEDASQVAAEVGRVLETTVAPRFWRLHHREGDVWRCADGAAADLAIEPSTRAELDAGRIVDATARRALDGAALLVPLRFEARLEGLLVLGAKNSGAVYGPRDLELLRTLANQTGLALRNAASYRRITELLSSLETRVEERTRELQSTHAELAHAYDDLKSAQAQLVQAEKMASLGTLVAGVAHEINNPVSFVSSSIDLISTSIGEMRGVLDRHLDGNGARAAELAALRDELDYDYRIAMLEENAAICREGAGRAARIVADLRTFCRPGNGRREPADLHAGLEQSLRLLQGEYKGRIEVRRDYGDLPPVRCDPGQMSQVFLNLLANAGQAIDGNGTVFVRTRCDDDRITIEIEDTGRGIDEAAQARIFDPFYTTKQVGKGTGLGLSIVRSIVEAHGGAIAVRSRIGSGSLFTLTLPADGGTP